MWARRAILIGSALLYFGLAVTTISLTSSNGSIASAWPANAVLLALMLQRERREWSVILVCGLAANVFANVLTRGTFWAPILFGSANMLEILVAASGLYEITRRNGSLVRGHSSVGRFVLWAGIIAPVSSSLPGAGASWWLFGHPFRESLLTWIAADALGLLIFTPFFYSMIAGEYRRYFVGKFDREKLESLALLGLTFAVCLAVFRSDHLPILFLAMFPLILVSFRLGWPGIQMAIMIVAVTGSIGTAAGHGPIVIPSWDAATRTIFFQFFLACLLLSQYPIVAALAMREDLVNMLRDSEGAVRLLASHAAIVMVKFSPDGECIKAAGQCEDLLGLPLDFLSHSSLPDLSAALGVNLERAHHEAALSPRWPVSMEFQPAGRSREWLEATFRAALNDEGTLLGTTVTIQDVTGRKRYEARLLEAAHTDALTEVLNRAGFMARLDRLEPGSHVCLAMIDIDRFKQINDGHGHQAGDLVLKALAQEIGQQVRSSDAVGRLGGDEFVILLEGATLDQSREICRRLVDTVGSRLVEIPGAGALEMKISCGLAQMGAEESVEELMHHADVALYDAKGAGRGRLCVYDAVAANLQRAGNGVEDELARALREAEFELYFQPIVSAQDRRIEGFEALLRWNHPVHGLLLPSEFIAAAEQNGQIVPIGHWVLHEACRVAVQMPADIRIAVNVSPVQFHRPGLVPAVKQALADSGLDASRLELEITESALLAKTDSTMQTLRALQALGVRIALDDFGVGYSGLGYLLDFPFERIKIDRSFVSALQDQTAARSVIEAIAGMARTMRIETTAEGIENEAQFHELRKYGCTSMQGYLFGRPANLEQCLRLADDRFIADTSTPRAA